MKQNFDPISGAEHSNFTTWVRKREARQPLRRVTRKKAIRTVTPMEGTQKIPKKWTTMSIDGFKIIYPLGL